MRTQFSISVVIAALFIAASAGAGAKAADEEKPKWDVNAPPGASHDAAIDVDSGTWMTVDVSPDGKQVAFDLLGDLYVMPIGGGEAKEITSGVAWDMQPRYSPDGQWIAFTSDRGAGDNIWIARADGSDPRPVTKEDFRLLNSPAWSPDGEFIAARKHFTSRRSIGTGEIWLYHRSGGEGLQMTKGPSEQKDLGEPAFSPDGKELYFSQDVTPGLDFEYNKDSNAGIYAIKRLDRETGEIDELFGGAGGAIRPTPSRDGKQLAFVRRVRGKSVLFVADLASRVERPVYRELERDMQETWAIHGVYPAFAWMPGDREIVLWAAGKILRIDVAAGTAREIPFRVRGSRTLFDVVRSPIDPAPGEFDTKMLRWVEVSPKGDLVVYQALGHLYVRALPAGTPRRLTKQTDHFEFYPSFSRDGLSIVYTTWDDESLGSVRVAPAGGGEGRVVTSEPGHYTASAISPDGGTIVFRNGGSGSVTSPVWSGDPGLFTIPFAGGKRRRLSLEGDAPHFGARSDRVYFTRRQGEKRALMSLDLDGSDERTEATSENATEFRVSPDARWLAFTEKFNAWIVPFARSSKPLELGPEQKAIPMVKASRDAGNYLRWSGDSRKLHWSLGPELFTRDLKDAFAFVAGAPETLPPPAEKGLAIGFARPYDVPLRPVALIGGRVITMRGDEILDDATILIEGNRIAEIGPRASIAVPRGATLVDITGKTVIPGLVDVHWHGSMGDDDITPEQNWYHYAALGFGVTTIHDPSNSTSEIFAASELAKAGLITAPRIFSTGTILYGAKAPFKAEIASLDDARSHLRRMKAVGAFSVKSYSQPRRDQRQMLLTAARELGMMVVPEGGSLFQHNMTMVVDGHTTVEHSLPVAHVYDDVLQLWSKSGTAYTPTLIVGYGGIWGENYWYQKTNVWENERLLTFVPREVVDARSRRRFMAPEDEFNHIANAAVATRLADAGVPVLVGAHGQREGLGAHWEMWMLAQGGMKPHDVLRAATIRGATALGLDAALGSVERGKLADLVVLDADPLSDIRNTVSVRYTVINGRIFEAATMNEIGDAQRRRAPFFWEKSATRGIVTHTHAGCIAEE
jgi:imidazolonepropionase-like amidohydrolase/Tol biopolymer transport system component